MTRALAHHRRRFRVTGAGSLGRVRSLSGQLPPGGGNGDSLAVASQLLDGLFGVALIVNDQGRILAANPASRLILGREPESLVGGQFADLAVASDRSSLQRAVKLAGAAPVRGLSARCRHQDGTPLPMEWNVTRLPESTTVCCVGRAVDRSNLAVTILDQHLRLLEVVQRCTGFEEAVMRCMRVLADLGNWDYAEAWVRDPERGVLVRSHLSYYDPTDRELQAFDAASHGLRFAAGEGLPGAAWDVQRPKWLRDVWRSPRFIRVQAARQAGLRSAFAVPFRSGGPAFVVMVLLARQVRPPNPWQMRSVASVSRALSANLERLSAQRRLEVSEQRYQSLFLHNPDAVFSFDAEGRFTSANPACQRIFGYTPAELLGQHFTSYLAPVTREAARQRFLRITAGEPQVFETAALHRDGHLVEISVTGMPARDAEAVSGAFVIATDISARKAAEARLRESEARFATAFHASPAASTISTLDEGVFIDVNDSFLALLGYAWGEVVGATAPELGIWVDAADRDRLVAMIRRGESIRQFQTRMRTKSGAVREVMVSFDNIILADQACLISSIEDVTDRLQAERLLAGQTRILEMVARGMGPTETLTELARLVEAHAPEALCSILLMDTDGVHLRHGAAPSLPDAYSQALDGLAVGPAVGSCGTAAYRKERIIVTDIATDPLWVEYRDLARQHGLAACWSNPFCSTAGQVLGTFALYYREPRAPTDANLSVIDLCARLAAVAVERWRNHDQLQRLNAELEQRVAQRTRDLQAAVDELEAFAYSVSHDLRAPLRSINGFSQALVEDCADHLNAVGRDYLARICAASERMGGLIDDLLLLSRVSRSEMRWETVDLTAIVHGLVEDLRRGDPGRQVDLVVQANVQAAGDPRLLRIVLQNLLDNAWKFTSRLPRAQVEFGAIEQDDRPVFFLRDNGAGFDMAYADKLFMPFQRLHPTREFPGTGIGLATVQRIVHRHGGQAWAAGQVGAGATFFFTLT